MVKWVSAFWLTNNKWRWWTQFPSQIQMGLWLKSVIWSKGRQLSGAVLRSLRDPGELTQWLRVMTILSRYYYYYCYSTHSFIHSGTHHYESIAPNIDINLQSGRFWAMSTVSFRERFIDFRSCWVVFTHVVWGVLVVCSSNSSVLRAFSLISSSWATNSDAFRSADITTPTYTRIQAIHGSLQVWVSLGPLENWRRPPGCPNTTWMKTIQRDRKSMNLSLNEAIDVAQNRPLWRLMSTFGAMHSEWCMPEMNEWMNEWGAHRSIKGNF